MEESEGVVHTFLQSMAEMLALLVLMILSHYRQYSLSTGQITKLYRQESNSTSIFLATFRLQLIFLTLTLILIELSMMITKYFTSNII